MQRLALRFALAALTVLVAPRPAAAQSIYATRFENPPFIAGVPLVGQDGWVAPPVLSPNAAVISTAGPRQGKQSVRVWGGDLDHQDFINAATGGYYDAIGSYRHGVEYDTGGTQVVRVSAHVRVDGPRTATGNNFFSASVVGVGVDDTGSSNGIGELAISSDGHVYGDSNDDLVPTFLVSAPITLGEWHELAIVDDFAARTYSFYVDGERLGTFPFDPSITSNIFRRGSLLAYTAPDTATLKKANYTAHYDKFSIKVVHHQNDDDDGGGD
jgi:hypothetical protein